MTTLVYLFVLSLIILFFHKGLRLWGLYIVGHFLVMFLIVALMWSLKDAKSKTVIFFRDWHPAILFLLTYEELDYLVTIIFPIWANQWVVNMDLALFGVHPTVWLERIAVPWLTELMNFFYAFYLLLIPVAGLPLYFKNKRRDFHGLLLNAALAYYVCYICFLLFPAEHPLVTLTHLQTSPLKGRYFLKLVEYIRGFGAIRGASFPSAHVSGAFAILFSMYKYERKIFYILLIFVLGLAFSTVYCRYHHAVDVVAGVLIAAFCCFIGMKIHQRWGGYENGFSNKKKS